MTAREVWGGLVAQVTNTDEQMPDLIIRHRLKSDFDSYLLRMGLKAALRRRKTRI